MRAGKGRWALAADRGERRAGLRLGVLAALAAGLSLGGVAARLVPAPEAHALVGALGPAVEAAARLPTGAFLLGAVVLWGGGVALIWLSGLTVAAAPVALAAALAQTVAVGFAAALLAQEAGPAGVLVALLGVALPAALCLPVFGWGAVEALDFALGALGPEGGAAARPRLAGYLLRGACAVAVALTAAGFETVVVRPALAMTVHLTGL